MKETTGARDMEIKVIFELDGNMWCARYEDFNNLHDSNAGFGETPTEALTDLLKREDRFTTEGR